MNAAAQAEPEVPILDFQCQNRDCKDDDGRRTTYVIAAHAIQRAEPIDKRSAA